MKGLFFIFASLVFPAVLIAGRGDALVHAKLMADVSQIAPGQTFHVGVLLKIEPDWHIYWKYPGDSGLATSVKLQLPAGFSSGPVEYPFPSRIMLPGEILNYVYEDETMLIIPVTAPKDLAADARISIAAKVNWLVCKDICLPGSAAVDLSLPVPTIAASEFAELFQHWMALMPVDRDPEHVENITTDTELKPATTGLAGSAEITIRWKILPSDIEWFPAVPGGVMVNNINIFTLKNTTEISYHVDVSSEAGNNRGIESVVVYTIPGGRRMALTIPVRGH